MSPQPKILVVEDEAAITELIALNLRHNGYSPIVASTGNEAQQELDRLLPDLILLDWMLPGDNGITLAKRWRANERTKHVPIIFLTARSTENDLVAGLDAGADDYMSKPFSIKELLARIRAILRRNPYESEKNVFALGDLTLDAKAYRVQFGNNNLKLGPIEFKLLLHLIKNAERVQSRTQLLDHVWGDHASIEERTVDVHIKRLRETMGQAGSMIETVRGVGYRITAHRPVNT